MHVTAFAIYGPIIGTVLTIGGYVIALQSGEHALHLSAASTFATFMMLSPLIAFGGVLLGLLPAVISGFCIGFMASRGWTERRLRWHSLWVGALSSMSISVPMFVHSAPVARAEHESGVYLLALVGAATALLATLLTTGLRVRLREN